jgi:hypothetical protein
MKISTKPLLTEMEPRKKLGQSLSFAFGLAQQVFCLKKQSSGLREKFLRPCHTIPPEGVQKRIFIYPYV